MNDGSIIQSADGNITLRAPGNVLLSVVNADSDSGGTAGDVIVTADYNGVGGSLSDNTGAITDNTAAIPETSNIIGASAVLVAATGIGASDIETAVTTLSADATTGDVDIHNTHASDVTVTSLTTGSGDIMFVQDGGGNLELTTATTPDGTIWIQVDDNGNLVLVNTVGLIDAGGTYDPNNDDRSTINFLDVPILGRDPGVAFDLAVYLASTRGNVTVGSPVIIADNGALVIDAYDTVAFGGTFETGSDFDWLEACSRITESLTEALHEATLPYVNEFGDGINPFADNFDTVYVLRGGLPDAWVLEWAVMMQSPPIAFDLRAFGPERLDDPNIPGEIKADLENAYMHDTDVLAPTQP